MIDDVNALIVMVTGVITILSYFFISVRWIAKLENRVQTLEKDLNNLKQITKQMINTETWILKVQITHIQEFLERSNNYNPPTMERYNQ